jgi:nucleoid-associated protein YgaU
MSRGNAGSVGRCLAVWLVVTGLAVAAGAVLGGSAAHLLAAEAWRAGFDGLLVDLAGLALLACAAWLWLVTTATALDVTAGRVPVRAPGTTRRLVLAACGVAIAAGAAAPAFAGGAGDDPAAVLVGLALPDRVSAPAVGRPVARAGALPGPAHEVVVRPGDSLWRIAEASLPAGAGDAEVDARCRALYAANRAVVGADPDLIHPGQRLRLPDASPTTDH